MCIIIGGLKKHLRRDEQIQGMRRNDRGYAICVVHKKKDGTTENNVVRSLNPDDIMKVWDRALPDDYVVTHSRIPSAGGLNANMNDVHGWTMAGVTFFHNGTMSSIKDVMKGDKRTDSEFFFKEIFIPLWLRNNKVFDKTLELVCSVIADGGRFCFVFPDGTVKYIGEYCHDHNCMFSNTGYRVYGSYGTTTKGTSDGSATRGGFCVESSSDLEDSEYMDWWRAQMAAKRGGKTGKAGNAKSDEPHSTVELEDQERNPEDMTSTELLGGITKIIPLMLERSAYLSVRDRVIDEASKENDSVFKHLMGREDGGDYSLNQSDEWLSKAPFEIAQTLTDESLLNLVDDYADELFEDLDDAGVSYECVHGDVSFTEVAISEIENLRRLTAADAHMVNLVTHIDHPSGKLALVAHAFVMYGGTSAYSVPQMCHREMSTIWTSCTSANKATPETAGALNNFQRLLTLYHEACKARTDKQPKKEAKK